ncbi:hypothetical protein PG991_006275 [Apiospora marii]|uniref:Ubiquinol-cytochrome-c reductase cytochrome c1 n=1 Tax=Apiospora marii TaxID=335849 RepID=A0ABR1SDD9_9PEZI
MSHEDERAVYLALKGVFSGALANIRKIKPIRNLISHHKPVAQVAELLQRYGEAKVHDTTRRLLADGIFASAEKAQARFQGLVELSPVLPAEWAAPEVEPAHDGSDVLSDNEVAGEGLGASLANKPIQTPVMDKPLLPVHLPFPSQHKLLVHLQQLLERACYGFATKHLPQHLQKKGWDCPEAMELNHWVALLSKSAVLTKSAALRAQPSARPLDQLCRCVTDIRHTAVHRLRITAAAVENFLRDAEDFTELLRDPAATQAIALIRWEVQGTVDELEENTRNAHDKLDDVMQEIGAHREELQNLEKLAMSEMQRESSEYQSLAARSIDSVIPHPQHRPVFDADLEVGEIIMVNGIIVREGPDDEEMGGFELE